MPSQLISQTPGGNTQVRKGLSDFFQFDDETILWSASLMLLKHLQQPNLRQTLQGKRVLELGSGLGHLGLGVYRLGAHVTCTERPQELDALKANIAAQLRQGTTNILEEALVLLGQDKVTTTTSTELSPGELQPSVQGDVNTSQGSIQAVALEWGQEGFERSPLSTQQLPAFDFIICSELYYIERLFPDLLWTWKRFAGPQTIVWSIFIDRPFSFMFFSLLHDEGCWEVEAVTDFDNLGLDPELQVHMHRIALSSTQ